MKQNLCLYMRTKTKYHFFVKRSFIGMKQNLSNLKSAEIEFEF